ncbi:oxygenase MpaB family protein [Nocardia callitridis]|uniref:oxygenase MpaB family protein n=1 Tax=Nocardia callitridis TaxID=648753 RepID=UPI0031EF6D4A
MIRPSRAAAEDTAPTELDITRFVYGASAFLGGTANVIMQLSNRPVGYGVLESTVDSGKVTLHPLKRLRTTLTYLSVALLGTERDREDYREAVNVSHRAVHSNASSPVRYNAFDPALQLWVAACLYWGTVDLYERMRGPVDAASAELLYQHGAHLGTTLQMRADMWPPDREAFTRYWDKTLAETTIDPPIREYFDDLIDLKMLPLPLRVPFAGIHRFFVSGLLPQHLREQMGITWSERDERRLDRVLRTLGATSAALPKPLRMFPFNAYLIDMRIRRRLGRGLV